MQPRTLKKKSEEERRAIAIGVIELVVALRTRWGAHYRKRKEINTTRKQGLPPGGGLYQTAMLSYTGVENGRCVGRAGAGGGKGCPTDLGGGTRGRSIIIPSKWQDFQSVRS